MINKAIDLLYLAKQSNIEITLLDGKLQLKVPKDTAIDNSLLEEIKINKQLIIDFLQSNLLSKTVNKISKTEKRIPDSNIPLSYSQERLWFLDKMEGSVQYHMPAVFRLKGKLNIEALSQALKMLVRRHEAVRTVFEEKDGSVFQKIISDADWQLKVLTGIKEANLANLVQNLVHTPFDLTKDYLLRATLIEVKPNEHLMVAVMHHIASDGWSRSVLVKEIVELYDSFNSGRPFELPTLELQYSDFAIWQRKALREVVLEQKLNYWKEKLLAVPSLQLPTDFKRPSIWNASGDTETDQINKLLTKQLRALSQDNRSTLFMTLLAAFKVLLFRHSSQTDVCVGTPIAGRDQKELENLIGFFVNTLALRTEFTAEMPFAELLEKVRKTTLEAYEHQDIPFEKVVDEVVTERDISRNPLFQVMFVMLNTPEIPELSIGEIQLLREPAGKTTAKFDIQFFITENEEGLHISVEYCTALFSRETIKRLITHFKNLLTSIVEHPNYKLCNLQMLSPDEEAKLLTEFNNTKVQYPEGKTVIDIFENQVEKSPDAAAIVFESDQISFTELNQRANKLAHYLLKLGAKKETIIPICLERGFEMLVGIFGILKAGCAYVPIDPEYPEDRIQFMLDDSEADIIVTTRQFRGRIENSKANNIIELDYTESKLKTMSVDNPGVVIDVQNLAYVIYTSGSTGKPKGAMNEHRGLYNRLNWAQDYFKLSPNDVVLQKTTFSFDVSVWELIWPLMVGSKLVLAKPGGQKDNVYLKSVIEANKVTMLHFVPSMLGVFLPDLRAGDCPSLDKVLCSGEALQPIHAEAFRRKLPNATLHNLYGPTEASIDVTCWTMSEFENEMVPIGKPVSNTTIYLLDASGQLAPLGGIGEIHIGGVQVARGYLNRPELTAEKFIRNPFDSNGKSNLYRTGDIGRWLNDGNLEYLGRIDDQVKIRGFRVELSEVESAINSLNEITANCALVKPNPDGVQKLVCYYVPDFKIVKEKEKVLYQAQVANWKALYENEYGSTEDLSEINEELNLVGWNDSFTGHAIPESHMKLWIDDIVELVLSEKNQSILEIGCGTGLIFYQLAGKVQKYFGTDLSSTAINQIKNRISKGLRNYGDVDFKVKGAHEVVLEKYEIVNTILLNSIVQYFPGEEYMNTVLENCLNLLKDGGRIIVGDVRDLRLLNSFKGRLQLQKMQNSASVKEFNWAVEMDLLKEEELCFNPAYFLNLQKLHPEIKHVELIWKQADYLNELSAYRFTAILYVGNAPQIAKVEWQIWDSAESFKNNLERINAGDEKIFIKNLPNPRHEQDSLLKEAHGNHSIGSVGELQKLTDKTSKEFEEIKELMQLAVNNGYSYQLLLNENPLKVNLVFEKGDKRSLVANDFEIETNQTSTIFTNIPLFTDINSLIQKEIRLKIQEVLPDYMIPTEFLPLKQLPLTINGKIDRKFLSQREDHSLVNRLNYKAPESDLEKTLVQIWEELLHIERIGVNDNFFELGGHSLLVIRMISACRNQLKLELNIREVFLFPTIALLSKHIQLSKDDIIVLPALISSARPAQIPLSFAQERLWFIDKLEGSTQYHIPFVLRLKGDLNIDLLQQSFQQIVNRHEVLRTVIKEQNGEGFQYVKPTDKWKLMEEDCGHYSSDSLKQLIKRLISGSFDLSKDDMIRAHLLRIKENDFVLVVTMHHIASDGWSISLLVNELVLLYNSLSKGQKAELPYLPVQYADYAIWQRNYLQGNVLDKMLTYWKETLKDCVPINLPVDFPRQTIKSVKGASTGTDINKELKLKLQEFSQKQGTTLYMTLLSIFKLILSKYSNQNDITVGTSVAGRHQSETEGLIGFFVNSLALRTEINYNDSFVELLEKVKQTTLSAFEHQQLPFEKVVEVVSTNRDLSQNPVFQVMFVYQNTPEVKELKLGQVSITPESNKLGTSQFDLTCNISENANGIHIAMQYCTDLFQEETIKSWLSQFEYLIKILLDKPVRKLSELEFVLSSERQILLEAINSKHSAYPIDKNILYFFEEQTKLNPESTALIFEKSKLSYQKLNEESNQLAHYLISKGVKVETLIPICMDRSLEMIVGILGILKAGAAYVPIDPNYPSDRINFMLDDCKANLLITNRKQAPDVLNSIEVIDLTINREQIREYPITNPEIKIVPENLAYVIYTSGSTGRPKGVLIEHRNLVSLFFTNPQVYDFCEEDIWTLFHSFCFDFSVWEIFGALLFGGKLVIVPEDCAKDTRKFAKLLVNEGVTVLNQTPSAFNVLQDEVINSVQTIPIRYVIFGGEPLLPGSLIPWKTKFPDCKLINMYGITETTIHVTYQNMDWPKINSGVSIIGKPIPSLQVYILDSFQHILPLGVPGEIYVGGEGLARGYLNNPELTDSRFIANPFTNLKNNRIYKSGDLGKIRRDGTLEYLGRIDNQVKIRGYRIELGEIENSLLLLDEVEQTVVLAKEDSQGVNRLIAYVVLNSQFEKVKIISKLKEKLPEYMIPAFWVEMKHLPLTSNGKVDKKALPDPIETTFGDRDFLLPQNETQVKLAKIWCELLVLKQIGIHDNFFEAGGHSLLANRLIASIRNEFNVEVSIKTVFEKPDILSLSEHILNHKEGFVLPKIHPENRPSKIPLSFSQERIWFIDQLRGSVQYHSPYVLPFKGKINIEALEKAIREIVNRHEILRTVIREDDGNPYQWVLNADNWKMDQFNALEIQSNGIPSQIQQYIHKPFDLAKDPMLRVLLISKPNNEYVLVAVFHHIASDGWTRSVFVSEIVDLYASFSQGKPSQLKPLTLQYADYAIWQRKYLEGKVLNNKLSYWRQKLNGVIPLRLPADFKRPDILTNRGASYKFKLDSILRDRLKSISLQTETTLFMTLSAAFKILLSKYSGQKDIVVGSAIAGRQQKELENMIGFFVNTLALRDVIPENSSFEEFLKQVKITTLEAFENQDAPFEKVVETVNGERDLGTDPLVQVVFTWQNTPDLPELNIGDSRIEGENYEHTTALFDLFLSMSENSKGMHGYFEYNIDLFERSTIERMFFHFERILNLIAENPEVQINEIDILSKEEKHQLLDVFNSNSIKYPMDQDLVQLFERQVSNTPENKALSFENESMSYLELNEKANQVAHFLINKGVVADTLVPVFFERNLSMVIAILGVLKAGGAYVPIDPDYPNERITFMLEDIKASVLLTEGACVSIVENIKREHSGFENLDIVDCGEEAEWKSSLSKSNPCRKIQPHHLAYVIYTSGSTGKPKGVLIEHRNVVRLFFNEKAIFDFNEKDVWTLFHSFCFDFSVWEMYGALLFGGKVVIVSKEVTKDVTQFVNLIAKHKVTVLNQTPSAFYLLQDVVAEKMASTSIRYVIFGGEALNPSKLLPWKTKFPKSQLINMYGITETTVHVTYQPIEKEEIEKGSSIIGKPIPTLQAYILDSNLKLLPIGVAGELYIGGDGLARGYLNRIDLTAERFISNPFSGKSGLRLYKTGDSGRWLANGTMEYLGRIDEQVKIRGYRIELGEVESAINSLTEVSNSCVVVRQDDSEINRLVAYYLPDRTIVKTKEKELYLNLVETWKELYNTEYQQTEDENDVDYEFNIIGWNDSFHGGPIPAENMRMWLDDIVTIILEGNPQNVLEIGSGTGLIYYQLADKIRKYYGADFSKSSVQQISAHVAKGLKSYCETDLRVSAAHEVLLPKVAAIDTIILNSIIQYFPSEDYIHTVIKNCMSTLQGKGRIILGDVRDFRLLALFKARLNLNKLKNSAQLNELEWLMQQEVLKEEELCFLPQFYSDLKKIYSDITHVEIQWKQGDYVNELTLYRFTVVIYVGIEKEIRTPNWTSINSKEDSENIIKLLNSGVSEIGLKDVVNPRLSRERIIQSAIEDVRITNIGELHERLEREDVEGNSIKEILNTAKNIGLKCKFLVNKDPLKMDVYIDVNPSDYFILNEPEPTVSKSEPYTNIPLFKDISALIQKDIRTELSRKLPEYMIPAEFMAIEKLPLTKNGKTDRKFLSTREDRIFVNKLNFQAAQTQTELEMATIWQELLVIEKVGIHDNFFEIGGHSLLGTRLISAIRKKLKVEITIKDLFMHPTINALSSFIDTNELGNVISAIIAVHPRPQHIPLSFSQERMWFIDQLEGSVQYNSPTILRLKGNLNLQSLERAIQEIVNRHEALRTVFVEEDGKVFQIINNADNWHLMQIDGSLFKENKQALKKYIETSALQPFNLSKDYMVRAELITLDISEFVLIVTMHHIASDAWSLSIVVSEVIELYNSFVENREAKLPSLPLQYADYSIWQRNYLQGVVLDRKIDYWINILQNPSPLNLPTDYPRPSIRGIAGAVETFKLNKDLSDKINLLSHRQETTLFMTLLAAFKVLLCKYSNQDDISVGTSIANRPQVELENLIGYFVNTLTLRTQLDYKQMFTELLQKVKITTLGAYQHQDVPFEKLVEAVVKERDPSHSPLFQVMLVLVNTPDTGKLKLGDVELKGEGHKSKISKFDLTFHFNETPGGLQLSVEYSTDLFKSSTIHRMVDHFITLLTSITENPQQKLQDISIASTPEQTLLLTDFGQHIVTYPQDKTITELFEWQAAQTPDQTALTFENKKLTYHQLNQQANQLAHALIEQGVKPETLVPIYLNKGHGMIIAILGVLKAGGAYVPIDSEFPLSRVDYMLKDSGAKLLLSERALSKNLDSSIHKFNLDELDLNLQPTSNPQTKAKANSLAYVIYTSGSTGQPKGVMIEHGNLTDYVFGLKQNTPIGQCSNHALVSTIATDLGNTVIYGSLLSGGNLHVFSKETTSDPEALSNYFKQHQIDCLKIVPSHFKALSQQQPLLPQKLLIFGGEALKSEDVKTIQQADPNLTIVNHYGPTETTIGKLLHTIESKRVYGKTIPIGKPFSNTKVYVLDAQQHLSPIGVPGQLYIAGDGLARGYLNNEALTNEKFTINPYNQTRMYATGDLVKYLEDGNLEYLGRIDQQVKIRGYRIELSEIERALNQIPTINQSVVIAKEDKQGNKQLLAYVVGNKEFDKQQTIQVLKQSLPDYMIPASITQIDEIPLTLNGKIDYKALPDPEQPGQGGYSAPQDETEQRLAEIWQEILEVDQVGRNDDFFELGGHSLLAIRLISAVRKAFETEMPIGDIFDYPTIAQLKTRLNKSHAVLPAITPQPKAGPIPLSFSQERLWFIDKLEGSRQYHIPSVLRLKGELNIEALQNSIQQIVNRHEILRTTIQEVDGQGYQYIKAKDLWKLQQKLNVTQEQLPELVKQLIDKPFNLNADDMLRASLLELENTDHVLVVTLHHIASDGWSTSILVKELVKLYESYIHKQNPNLAALPVQYADYAIWQRTYLQGELLETKLDYWKDKLQGAAPLDLPTDYPRPALQSNKGAVSGFKTDKPLSDKLNELSKAKGTTLFMTLLAAFKVLLSRYSNQNDITVGTPMAGRQQQELEGLIGFFINTLALRDELNPEHSFDQLLQQVKTTTLEAYQHQDVPFEKVVEAVTQNRDLSRSPVFQVMFVFQNTPDIPQLQLGEVRLSRNAVEHDTAQFDLTLNIAENPAGLQISLEYCTDLFSKDTITRFQKHFERILLEISNDSTQKIGEISILTDEEENQILNEFNSQIVFENNNQTILDLFQLQCQKTPDKVAVTFNSSELTYQELDQKSNCLANYLLNKGVKPNMLVPVCLKRSPEMLVSILAILKTGAAYVPIDSTYPESRINFMLEDTKAQFIISESSLNNSTKTGVSPIAKILIDSDWSEIQKQSKSISLENCESENLAYIIYTSGSTGQPKGVMVTHQNLLESTKTRNAFYSYVGSVFLVPSFAFDSSVAVLFWSLTSGGKLILCGDDDLKDPKIVETILQETETILCVPSYYKSLCDQNLLRQSQLSKVILAGEKLSDDLVSSHFSNLPLAKLYNEYGPTENTVWATVESCAENQKVSIGKPIPGTKLYITGELGHLLPVGVPGEIWLGGSQVAKGYLNQKELTQHKFVKDLFDAASDARVYKTGDIGRWLPDGRVEYLGRQDDQVKVRGYRIETGEIELNLLQSSMVNQVIVVCSKDNLGENRLIAYIQPKSNYDKNVLIQFLKSKLPDYMIPMVWIEIETVPLTPNGKVDRSSLPLPLDKQVRIDEFLSPRNITEFKLVQIWSELLNVEAIGVTDNFFELGGHSLLVMRLASLVNKQFDVDLKIVDVFNNSTVEKLALFIEMQKGIKRLPSVTIEQRPIKVPLSYSQERLWFIHQLEGSIQYHIPSVIKLTGLLNVKALQQAFEKIIERHEILRTVILEENGIAFQKILNPISWKLNIIQLEDSNFELDSIIQQQIYKPFDLSKDFMLRSNLMQIKQDENLLVITMHHIASDGWSVGVLIQEMLELYQSFVDGREPQLPKLEIQYSDFSIWQRRHITTEYLENQLSYWRTKLEGSIPISLPIDFKRPAVQSKNGDLVSIKIEYDVSKKLSILSKQNGATLFMTLLAAFKILLSKHSNQEDIIVGTPVSGRVQKELEPLIGFFINTLVLRTQVNQNSTFDELLQDLKNTVLEAFSNQETPFEKVVEAVVSERDRSRSPLFQVMFVFQNKSDIPDIKLEQLSLHGVQQEHKTTQFELRCHILETSTGFQISMEYCTDLFSKQSIERLNRHFAKLLQSIVENPEAKLSELKLLEESETNQLLSEFNATQTQYPEDKTILDLFAQHVNQSPNSTSVVYENQSLSFQELDEKSNQLANYLIELGVKPDSLVAICMERSLEMMVGILGILKANAAYVPIDPDYPQQRIEYMLDDCKASIILSHSEVKISLPNNVVNLDTDWKRINQQAKTKPSTAPKPNHLAYVIYTSGSTGQPKGVMNEHSGLLNRLCWAQDYFKLTPKDKVLQKTTYSFDVSVWELLWPLISGAQLVFAKPGGHKDNVYLKEIIEKEQITMLHFVPSMLEVFLSDLPKEACPSLKQVLCSGEALKPSQVELFGQKLPQSKLFNLYGPTEAAIDVTCWEVEPNAETVPIGKPVANTQIYILNQQNQPVPIGVAGEIHIGGVQVARGYLNKAELTSEKFIPNPYSKTKTERLYKTGDLGKWTEDGNIEYLGRLDDQVKIRGYRIELGEIETTIAQIKDIKQSAVLAKEDAHGNKRLVAYVVTRNGFDKSKATAELQLKLPEYMVPQIWVELNELPLTPNGKIDRKALPEPDIKGQIQDQYVAPRNETEEKLAEIWKGILKLENIGIHDNFFELGGHSLMALRIISGIRQKFDFELEIVELVNEPTIAGISKIIIERKIR